MRKFFSLLFLCLLPVYAVGGTLDHSPIESVVENKFVAVPPTVTSPVDSPCGVSCNGGYASGTLIKGAPAGKTYVVTNKHVVNLGGKNIKTSNGNVYPSQVVAISPFYDLAILVVNEELPSIHLANYNPIPGTYVTLKGYGVNSGGFDKIRSGTISSCSGGSLTANLFISPGDSGSGFIDKNGNLVGIAWGASGNQSAGVSVSAIRDLLSTIPKNINVSSDKPVADIIGVQRKEERGPGGGRLGGITIKQTGEFAGDFSDPVIPNQTQQGGCPNGRCPLQK